MRKKRGDSTIKEQQLKYNNMVNWLILICGSYSDRMTSECRELNEMTGAKRHGLWEKKSLLECWRRKRKCLPLQMVDFVCVLSLFSIFLIGLIFQHLHSFSSTRLILTRLSDRVQLADLVLRKQINNRLD